MNTAHRLYTWVISKLNHRQAPNYLYGLSFCESSFFPVPPDVMLAPLSATQPDRALRLAFFTTVYSVLGGYFGYLIGALFFDAIQGYLQQSAYWQDYLKAKDLFADNGAWAIFLSALTPIPYKIFTVSAGVLEQNLLVFGIASLLGRGSRFFLVALLSRWAGPRLLPYVERNIAIVGWVVAVLGSLALIWLIWPQV